MSPDDLQALTDRQLEALHAEAVRDLSAAAKDQPNSEWHQACFAGLLMIRTESGRRLNKGNT